MRTLVATSFFLFPGIGVATSIQCRDLTLFAFTASLCRDLDLMTRPHFCFHPICFSVTTPLFMLRRHSVVLNLRAGRDSSFLVCLFSCRDVVIRSRPSSFFNQCNSYRDLTVLPFAEIYVSTSIPCHNLAVLQPTVFCVATLI